MMRLRPTTPKIFEEQGLVRKIFRNKELTSLGSKMVHPDSAFRKLKIVEERNSNELALAHR
jgi:hypothetical protein